MMSQRLFAQQLGRVVIELRRVKGRIPLAFDPVIGFMLLTLLLNAPLLCVIHCQLWMPLSAGSMTMMDHAQHMAMGHQMSSHSGMDASASVPNPMRGYTAGVLVNAVLAEYLLPSAANLCHPGMSHAALPDAPATMATLALQDHLLALLLCCFVIALTLWQRHSRAPPLLFRGISHPPRLRPPIGVALLGF